MMGEIGKALVVVVFWFVALMVFLFCCWLVLVVVAFPFIVLFTWRRMRAENPERPPSLAEAVVATARMLGGEWKKEWDQEIGGKLKGLRLGRLWGKRRVPLPGFEKWTRVYLTGGTAEAPEILLKVRFSSPDMMRSARTTARVIAFAFFCWLLHAIAIPVLGDTGEWWRENIGQAFLSAGLAWIVFFPLHWLFRRFLWRIDGRPLRMTFRGGGIEWKGEAQWRKRFGFGVPDRVRPGEEFQPEVVQHRKAAQELRDNEERRRRGLKPKPMYFQQSSEVMIYAGRGLPRALPVAEFAEDEHGEKARALVAAIVEAQRLALGAGQAMERIEQARAEEPPAGPEADRPRRTLRR